MARSTKAQTPPAAPARVATPQERAQNSIDFSNYMLQMRTEELTRRAAQQIETLERMLRDAKRAIEDNADRPVEALYGIEQAVKWGVVNCEFQSVPKDAVAYGTAKARQQVLASIATLPGSVDIINAMTPGLD